MLAETLTGVDIVMLLAVAALLVVLTFLSVAEMGLSRISRHKAASLADKGDKAGKALIRLVDEPERWVNSLLLTVNICQTVQATLTGIVAGRLFGAVGVAVGVVLNVGVFFVLAEAVPKTYAVLYPERVAKAAARPVAALAGFGPLHLVSRGLIGLTNVIVRGKGLEKGPFVNEQELLGIVETAAEEGVVEHEERELIESIIEFGDTVVREVMVPRPDIVTIFHGATVTQALDVALEHGYSRLPVLGLDGGADAVGLAFVKDLMRAERGGGGDKPVVDHLRSVRFVPENMPVNRLMREMQADKFHLALVADEYGALSGLITLEDCLEELVGNIVDEHDDEEPAIERIADHDYMVDGGLSISDLNELLDIQLSNEDWETVGGFLFGTLEHVPAKGETVTFGGWAFTVAAMEGRRVRRVRAARAVHHVYQ